MIKYGVQNCFGNYVFPVLLCFFGSVFLPGFLAICSILELEAAVPTVFAAFLSSNCSCNMVVCN